MRRPRGYAWIWTVVRGLLQIAGVLIVLLLGISGWMAWDSVPLKRDLAQVAQSFQVGGSPFLIPLPADRNSVVLVGGGPRAVCGRVSVRDSVVRSAWIGDQAVAIPFQQGVDLRPYAGALAACHTVTIALGGTMSFLIGSFTLDYAEGQSPRLGR